MHEGSVAAHAHRNRLAGFFVGAELARLYRLVAADIFHLVVDAGLETGPEFFHQRHPVLLAARNLVQRVFQLRGELVIHVLLEVLGQEARHYSADIGRVEALVLQFHVLAVDEGSDDGCVGRRAADAVLFQRLDQRGLAVSRWRLGEMLFQPDFLKVDQIAFLHRRQQVFLVVVRLGIVLVLDVDAHEARVTDGRPARAEAVFATAGEIDGHGIQGRVNHLAGDGAFPDQAVKPELVIAEMFLDLEGLVARAGRANRLVRLLRVLRLGLVFAR